MKIQIASDLHTEHGHHSPWLASTDADVLVLAGDIGIGTHGLDWAADLSQEHGKPVLYVAGNHEFYHHEYRHTLAALRETAQRRGVLFLEQDAVVIGGVRFLGTTLWTDYACNVQMPPDLARWTANRQLADHELIRYGDETFTPDDAYRLHRAAVTWLETQLKQPAGPTVVITHHGPSLLCEHPHFGMNEIAPCFYSERTELVQQADLWVFGHTHANIDIALEPGRLVSNQLGYPYERVPGGFNPACVLEL